MALVQLAKSTAMETALIFWEVKTLVYIVDIKFLEMTTCTTLGLVLSHPSNLHAISKDYATLRRITY